MDSLKSPCNVINTPNTARIKPLPSPHLLILETEKLNSDQNSSKFTQTIQEELESDLNRYNEMMSLYQNKVDEAQNLSNQLLVSQEKIQVRFILLIKRVHTI